MSGKPIFGLFCNPESRRVDGFSAALRHHGQPRPLFLAWEAILTKSDWYQRITPGLKFFRLESPGRNWRVEQQFLLRGSRLQDEESEAPWRQSPEEAVLQLQNEHGRIHPQRQWFLGWRDTLRTLSSWARRNGHSHRWLCPPEDVICMFDKAACQQRLEKFECPVAPMIGIPGSFDELWAMMQESGRHRIFLKPCHGSSASGVVALEASKGRVQAFSTVELEESDGEIKLFNRRRVEIWKGATEVRRLVDEICRERCIAQVWIPKAGTEGRTFDLRVVVVAGKARQVMVRLGNGPITNSQLLGGKGQVDLLQKRMGEEAWTSLLGVAETAMKKCFPRSLYAGFDLLVEPNFRRVHIAEVNAFGDLLPGVLHEGLGTYEWEVHEALKREKSFST